jgi:TPP-dependent pyruvate/acetoin dehydrogenase alpha subunit
MSFDNGQQIELLEDLLLTRRFEETVLDIYEDRGIRELPHSSIGQEAVGVGACHPLREDDTLVPSLRTRAVMLLRAPLEEVVGGMYGTRSGPSEGRTTQHHMGSSEYGILGTTGMVGAHFNPTAGAALGHQALGDDRVAVGFFGDGACQRSEFHTALNFATVRELPVVFVIENNRFTEASPLEKLVAVEDLAELAGHGLPTRVVDGQDVEAMAEATAAAAERARSGGGPTLIEAKTYRFRPHAETMPEERAPEELAEWKARDPVENYRETLVERGVLEPEDIEEMDRRLQADIDAAFEAVEDDELPDEEAMYQVYSDAEIDHSTGVVR